MTCPQEPLSRRVMPSREKWIGGSPCAFDNGIVCGGAVSLASRIEGAREQLVRFRAREVQSRSLDAAAQRRAQNRNRLGGPVQREQALANFIIDPRVAL